MTRPTSSQKEEAGILGTFLESHLVMIPDGQTWRPLPNARPRVDGPQMAVVVGPENEEIYCDEVGRVKVQFPWDLEGKGNETSSCWIRVAQGWAGSRYGSMAVPRIGHEVIVDFLEGDPDQPIITGRTYHVVNVPPHSLPIHKTRTVLSDLSNGITLIVRVIIRFAPVGIFGLVASTLASSGFGALLGYLHLLTVLIGCMLFVALVVNPLIVFWKLRRNPFPLVFLCLRESGITAFFTRSSAANIPVNMALSERLGLHEDTYSVSIPLGATINMAGAAITITVLSLAAVHTLGISVDIPTAILLSVVAAICACGASGVAGGSLLLIPLACSLFGIPSEIAMQVVAVGFIIGILQDSAETALNSSTDVLFTAAVCLAKDERN